MAIHMSRSSLLKFEPRLCLCVGVWYRVRLARIENEVAWLLFIPLLWELVATHGRLMDTSWVLSSALLHRGQLRLF